MISPLERTKLTFAFRKATLLVQQIASSWNSIVSNFSTPHASRKNGHSAVRKAFLAKELDRLKSESTFLESHINARVSNPTRGLFGASE